MRSRKAAVGLTVFLAIGCLFSGCGQTQKVPRRAENEKRPPVTLISEEISEEEQRISEDKEEIKLPEHTKVQEELDRFLKAFNEKAESNCLLSVEKDFVYEKYQDGGVFSVTGENDISENFWVRPDEEKVWKVNYYKDSDTGRVSVEINGMWIGSKKIDSASELYIWANDFLIIMLTEPDQEKEELLSQIIGARLPAEESPF